jgi:hypothetical protein
MSWLAKFYLWFWFHTEFWLTPMDRRPYTFIMRDWIYTHLNIFALFIASFYAGMIALSIWHGTASTIVSSLGSFVLAHLIWGSAWIEGQQEYPEYLGGEA